MLVLPIPFISIQATYGAIFFTTRYSLRLFVLIIILIFSLQYFIFNRCSFLEFVNVKNFSMTNQIETLRLLKQNISPEDTILDPSGLAYFVKPVTREWYSDTLFSHKIESGHWMNDLKEHIPNQCNWLLNTYRLSMLDKQCTRMLTENYRHFGKGLYLRSDDYRLKKIHNKLENYNELYSYSYP
jgi:hypothetical protein